MKTMLSFATGVLVGLLLAWVGPPLVPTAGEGLAVLRARFARPVSTPMTAMRWPVRSRMRMVCSEVQLMIRDKEPFRSAEVRSEPIPEAPSAAPTGGETAPAAIPTSGRERAAAGAQEATPLPVVTARPAQPKLLYDEGLEAYRQGRYAGSRDAFSRFLTLFPTHALAPNALYWTAECWYAEHRYEQAALIFARVVKDYPHHDKGPDALLKLAYCRLRQDRTAEGRQLLERLEQLYPGSAAARLGRQARSKLQGFLDQPSLAVAHG